MQTPHVLWSKCSFTTLITITLYSFPNVPAKWNLELVSKMLYTFLPPRLVYAACTFWNSLPCRFYLSKPYPSFPGLFQMSSLPLNSPRFPQSDIISSRVFCWKLVCPSYNKHLCHSTNNSRMIILVVKIVVTASECLPCVTCLAYLVPCKLDTVIPLYS